MEVDEIMDEITQEIDSFLLKTSRHKYGLTLREFCKLLEFKETVKRLKEAIGSTEDENMEQYNYYISLAVNNLEKRVNNAFEDLGSSDDIEEVRELLAAL